MAVFDFARFAPASVPAGVQFADDLTQLRGGFAQALQRKQMTARVFV